MRIQTQGRTIMDKFVIRGKHKREAEEILTASTESSGSEVSTETVGSAINITSDRQSESRCEKTLKSFSRETVSFSSEKENFSENSEECEDKTKDKKNKNLNETPRAFSRWKTTFQWLSTNSAGRAICLICVEATDKKLLLSNTKSCFSSRRAYVEDGFNTWKNAVQSFQSHEKSELHRSAVVALGSLNKASVIYSLSSAKKKEMDDARVALRKIFSTVKVLAKQGLAFRGGANDERSNFMQILKMRAEDVPELNTWLNRTGNLWIHHDIVNEILELFANEIVRQNLDEIKSAGFFAITLDETSDISRLEQVSICFRISLNDLSTKEIFMGFYETGKTNAETLCDIVQDVFARYDLKMNNLRGQCYDGASNVSGRSTGLQARIKEMEPRALYVHCNAHTLNLVVQDAIECVPCARNFIGTVKDVINFIRDSPKRMAHFKHLQSGDGPNLNPYCPTRWCMRIKSLKTIHNQNNYTAALQFFDELSHDRTVDCSISVKVAGFIKNLETFEFYFLLTVIIEIFERIEILNVELQKSSLNINASHKKVMAVMDGLRQMRESKFDILWDNSIQGASALDLEEPKLHRPRKIPKHLEERGASEPHTFQTPKDYYRMVCLSIFDQVIMSMNERFNSTTMNLLNSFENFAIGKQNINVDEILKFYNCDNSIPKFDRSDDFDKQKLTLHREMFLEIASTRNVIFNCLADVVQFIQQNPEIGELVPEYKKLLRILLTIPATSCTNE